MTNLEKKAIDEYDANLEKIRQRNKFKDNFETRLHVLKVGKLLESTYNLWKSNKKFDKKTTISKDILIWALQNGKLAELRLYLTIKDKHSGKFHKKDFNAIARSMNLMESTLKKLISCAKQSGLIEQRRNNWYNIIGIKRWNIAQNIMYPTLFTVPEGAYKTVSSLRTFCRTAQIKMAGKKAESLQRVNGCISKEEGTPLSISFISNYADVSQRTIARHKAEAQKKGWANFVSQFLPLEKGTKENIATWRENKNSPKIVIKRLGKDWFLCEQLPSLLKPDHSFKKKRITLSKEEKDQIRANFIKKDLIPIKRVNPSYNQSLQIAIKDSQEMGYHPFLV